MWDVRRAVERVQQAGIRLTAQRRALLELLPTEDTFTAQQLWDRARERDPSYGRATVFRCLELFARLGLVHRLHAQDGVARYRVCDLGEPPREHYHLSCIRCQRTVEFEDGELEEAVRRVARSRSFRLVSDHVVLFGVCLRCQAPADAAGHK